MGQLFGKQKQRSIAFKVIARVLIRFAKSLSGWAWAWSSMAWAIHLPNSSNECLFFLKKTGQPRPLFSLLLNRQFLCWKFIKTSSPFTSQHTLNRTVKWYTLVTLLHGLCYWLIWLASVDKLCITRLQSWPCWMWKLLATSNSFKVHSHRVNYAA